MQYVENKVDIVKDRDDFLL